MNSTLLALVVSLLPAALPETGTHLIYRGTFVADRGDPTDGIKKFELHIVVAEATPAGAKVYWTVSEDGRGKWSWADQFGRLDIDESGKPGEAVTPSLLYVRNDEGTSVVPITLPLFTRPIEPGATWEEGRISSRVVGEEKHGDRRAWRVEVATPFGRKRTLWVDKQSPVLVALSERVFVGQGEQHELKYELQSRVQLPADSLAQLAGGFESLLKLRTALGQKPRQENVVWSDEQLALLKRELPSVTPRELEPLARVMALAEQDAKDQKGRSASVAQFKKKAIGAASPDFKLDGVGGEPLTTADLKDHVTVLHFWEYRDSPLQEPYGQVGYLDFLHRKKISPRVRIVGVAVDDGFSNPNTRGRLVASVKKLRSFMNLGYPIVLDDGSALRKFGDPRVAGAKLPVFVVIGPDGRIADYHAGLMEVDRDRGLRQLEEAVKTALDK